MKDSGIEWIGEIPIQWKVLKIKYRISQNDGGLWGNDPKFDGKDKIVIRSTEQTIDGKWCIIEPAMRDLGCANIDYYRIRRNDLLITKSSGSEEHIGKTTLADNYFEENCVYYSNFIQRLKVTNYNSKYLWYILNSSVSREQFVYMQNSTSGIGNINATNINDVIIPVPQFEEQKRISDFLDSKCSEIDGLISDIQKQITTLEEYKRSVITESVTKGLNPDAEMKDSGIEWIGVIPKHWKIEKIKYHLKRNEPRNPGNKQVLSVYREYGVIPKDSRDDNHNVTSDDTSKYKYVVKNNLVINKMKAWQGSMGVSDYEGIVSPAYFIYIFTSLKLLPKYIHYLFRSSYKDEFRRISGGIREGQWDLSADEFENTVLLIPTISEQHKIIDYIQSKTNKIDSIISEKKKQIETIEEYKKSLIFEYVTGKKEVYVNE